MSDANVIPPNHPLRDPPLKIGSGGGEWVAEAFERGVITPPAYRLKFIGGDAPHLYVATFSDGERLASLLVDCEWFPPFAGCTLDEFVSHVQKHGGTVYKAVAER